MHDIESRHSYVKVNKSIVHLVQYGNGERIIKSAWDSPTTSTKSGLNQSPETRPKESGNQNGNNGKKIVVFLPGNPGLLGAYHDYLVLLYKTICCRSRASSLEDNPILLAISHNNFEYPEDLSDHVKADERIIIEESDLNFIEQSIAKSHEHNDIELQVLNKLIILKRLLKFNLEDCQLVFVGHSVGCYIILNLLQDGLVASVHNGSILIHPALENLAITEKGSYFARCFDLKVDYLLRSMAYLADVFLPKSFRLTLTKKFVCSAELVEKSSLVVIESLCRICCPKALGATIEMAKSEFASIKNLDHSLLIKPHVDRLRLIYAQTDHWVNAENRKELKRLYPNLHVEEHNTMHAFIMQPKTVIDYALKVGVFIQEFLD